MGQLEYFSKVHVLVLMYSSTCSNVPRMESEKPTLQVLVVEST